MNDNLVKDYGWSNESVPGSCNYIAAQIVSLVQKLNIKRALDLGAGNGALCSMIAKTGCEIVGVEYDPKGFEVARSFYPTIRFYNFGVQDDPRLLVSREGLFDAVVSTEVIEHLFSPHLLPLYAKHVLKDKGYLITSTPYHGYLKNLVLSIWNKWDIHHTSLWHGGHIKFWSKKTLTQLLKENGFETNQFCGVGRVPYLWKSMILVAQKTSAAIQRQS